MHEYHLLCKHMQWSRLVFFPSQTTVNKNRNYSDPKPQWPSEGPPGGSDPCEGVPRTKTLGQADVHGVHPAHGLHQVLPAEPDLHRPLGLQDPSSGERKQKKALGAPDFQVSRHKTGSRLAGKVREWFKVGWKVCEKRTGRETKERENF